jgi:3-deoxy-D-manno-octulosonic-acid transferase
MNNDTPTYKPTLAQEAFRWFYSLLLLMAIPFAFVNFLLKGKEQRKQSGRTRFERFGLVAPVPKKHGYLFHCVSVGEVVAASCLIKRIMQEQPDVQITVTTTTATGSARVTDMFGDTVHHFYLPYDLPVAMSAMLKRVQPRQVLITEVELWPNLIHTCWKQGIPVVVINARMTDRSSRRYKKFPVLFEPLLRKLTHVCAQGDRDYTNYLFLGMEKEKLTLTQNIKFDQAAALTAAKSDFLGLANAERYILIGGSTHEPEESILLGVYKALKEAHPSLLLILVPRHPDRFDTVSKLIEKAELTLVKSADNPVINDDCDVLLVNEMGRLNAAYDVADIAFVGGSIAQRGGHNALEPAAKQLPVIMGTSTHNNPEICSKLAESGGLKIVSNEAELCNQVSHWLNHTEERKQAGLAGYHTVTKNSGALDKTLVVVNSILHS